MSVKVTKVPIGGIVVSLIVGMSRIVSNVKILIPEATLCFDIINFICSLKDEHILKKSTKTVKNYGSYCVFK